MIEFLTQWYTAFNEATKSNPMLGAAVGLWGLTVVSYILRSVPSTVCRNLWRQSTTFMTLNNSSLSWANRNAYHKFNVWFSQQPTRRFSRALAMEVFDDAAHASVGPGYGYHFFFLNGKLFWFYKEQQEASATSAVKESITISTLGRSTKVFTKLVDTFSPPEPPTDTIEVYSFVDDCWCKRADVYKRPLDSVIIPAAQKQFLLGQIADFNDRRGWYLEHGFAHKLTLCLHGQPGTGKTSLVKALAAHHNKSIYAMNLSHFSDSKLEAAVSTIPKGQFVLIEDFDAADATRQRMPEGETADSWQPMTLTGLLNVLDGVIPLDETVLFMTTNHIAHIDAALLRKGRTDFMLEISKLDDTGVKDYIRSVYGDVALHHFHFESVAGCDLQNIVLEFKEDYNGFIQRVVELYALPVMQAVRISPCEDIA